MKNFFKRHLPTFAKMFGIVQARLESAYQQWGVRRWLQATFQDARFEFDFAAVRECCRKHLDLVENTPIIQKIRNLKIQFAVGVGGLKVIPNASDPNIEAEALEAWNEARGVSWENWARIPELGSNLSLGELTIQWEGMLFDVGNVLVQKTRDELGRPKIQTIDFLRLQTPPSLANLEGKEIIQGVRLTKIKVPARADGKLTTREIITGKPASYFIRDEFDQTVFAEIPADQIIHKFRAIRPGMMVGLPEAFSVINKIIDYTDLHIATMESAKINGKYATVHKTVSGEFDTQSSRRTSMKIQTQNASGAAVTKSYNDFYDVVVGAQEIAIPVGTDMKSHQVLRPSPAEQDYWDHIVSEICAGYNVPKLLVFPFSLQGTVTRADLDVCANAFRADFEIIASIVRDIYEWQTQWAVKFDRSMDGKTPANPLGCVIRPPRAPNVDIGYTAKALQIELELGVKTVQDVFADKNEDWRIQMRQNFEFLMFCQQLADSSNGKITADQLSTLVRKQLADSGKGTGSGDEEDAVESKNRKLIAA